MNEYKYKNNHSGFSLIEIMVAMLILATVFIGLLTAFPYSLSIVKFAQNETKAAYLAQEKIEELYQVGYSNIATGTIEVKHGLGTDNFQRETNVYCVDSDLQDSTTDMDIKKIITNVYYTNSISKEEKIYNLTILMTNK